MRDLDGKMYSFTLNVSDGEVVVEFDGVIYPGVKTQIIYNPITGVMYS